MKKEVIVVTVSWERPELQMETQAYLENIKILQNLKH